MIFLICKQHSIKVSSLILSLILSFSFAQAQTPDMPVSIHLKQADLKEFTVKIEKASGYSFIYGEEVALKYPITLSLKKVPLKVVLQKAFTGQGINFEITKRHIILKKKR